VSSAAVMLTLLLALQITSAQISLGVPSKRYLLDTKWGQLHYVTSRTIERARPTLLLFHSNPHSHLEFKEFLNDPQIKTLAPNSVNWLAFDYFGCGGSDDCLPPACGTNPYDGAHPVVTVEEFVSTSLGVLGGLGLQDNMDLVCIGHLKGGSSAIECARQLGKRARVMMAIDALYFMPSAVRIVMQYTNHTLHTQPVSSGQHLLDAWFQPSVAPCNFVNATYCQAWEAVTLAQNELKTLDRIRAFASQWQYIIAGLKYNDQLISPSTIKSITAKRYIAWGTTAMSMWGTDGFSAGVDVFNKVWAQATHNTTIIDFVHDASEGSMVQNASYYASMLVRLLHQK